MAFLFANQFPAGCCVTETDSDPALIRFGGSQIYPVGVSLEQAMRWVWISRAFTGSGSGQGLSECCSGNNPVYSTYNFPSSQSTAAGYTDGEKMSDLICPDFYATDFLFSGSRTDNQCVGSPLTDTIEGDFGFSLRLPGFEQSPIYLYNDKYYLPIGYNFGVGFNLNEGFDRTYFAGNLTIDGINFPLYSEPPTCNETPQANFTCTTSLEREAN